MTTGVEVEGRTLVTAGPEGRRAADRGRAGVAEGRRCPSRPSRRPASASAHRTSPPRPSSASAARRPATAPAAAGAGALMKITAYAVTLPPVHRGHRAGAHRAGASTACGGCR
ncbi:MAG: hypothetical protein MZU91_12580 [Desulfosudis oleivorans]|nr:hypothetical protein [Desulfosudis oleivorans]